MSNQVFFYMFRPTKLCLYAGVCLLKSKNSFLAGYRVWEPIVLTYLEYGTSKVAPWAVL